MFSLRDTLANRRLPPGYNINMGIVVLCGGRPASITRLRDSPCPQSVFVHFKSLLAINNSINQFIDTQFIAMQRLFAEGDVAVLRGTTEDLSGNPALQPLLNLNVGRCLLGQPTQDQNTLFANRNNVGNNELVVYIVMTLNGVTDTGMPTTFLGCATHPNGQPGAAVVQSGTATWLVAHEVGHVLGLRHVCQFPTPANPTPPVACAAGHSDSLMFPNVGWTNTPPDLAAAENSTMRNSNLTRAC
jgi:Metallo-peptidase family M12B Reprolysin-like